MPTVLIVEDDEAILETVAYNLEREGLSVLLARDGVEGLRLARDRNPDLVLLDLMLPRMSGLEVCRALRAERPVPVLMLTARDSEPDKLHGLALGADDYITKPFSMRELVARVQAALRRDRISRAAAAEGREGTRLEAGGLVLDAGSHEVLKNGRTIAMRPKEFELLEYLMRHPNLVLSRERILEAVWGYSYAGETRTVDVHIHWLREKLEDDPSRPVHLVTVRGAGYKFVP